MGGLQTDYHAKYFAFELTKRYSTNSIDKLAGTVASAKVDLNPHQVDAALFAFQSPLSKGAILADEVGLGKTIEAGLVISQKWAERKRRILIVTPSNLRKQWHQELSEKFFLQSVILETRSYKEAIKQKNIQPFLVKDSVIICSYQFARSKAAEIQNIPWDLVVLDEAHRLRNVYKTSNVMANTLKLALGEKFKLLLTATPLQNSLLELYGLISFIDDHIFGDLKSFKEQFSNLDREQTFHILKNRLKPICHRTLRRQVMAYVPYTKRISIVEEFSPDENENRLYNLVSNYLSRPNIFALPAGQRTLITLVLRKLLASSTFAIASALTTMAERLKAKLDVKPSLELNEDDLKDYESLEETAEEWPEDPVAEPLSNMDRIAIAEEIADLESFSKLATSIEQNSKGKALLKALQIAFAKALEIGAAPKAIIFTESRRTQSYLLRLLADSNFAEGIVLFNGTNVDESSKNIYKAWLELHQGSDRVTGSKTADMRSALVDYFREEGKIMIATEAGAEGINLQFCSLVVNYDLPWNPQRIEQRIGRCHRYGQKHDVVVVNFLNSKNAADQRVFQLLSQKFKLFEGMFGASDEVLGIIESGVDFEKRIGNIYQQYRQHSEIQAAFDELQKEMDGEINQSMSNTQQRLLENFDDEVREKLKMRDQASRASLSRFDKLLMQLTQHELNNHVEILSDGSFQLKSSPFETDKNIPLGLYELPRRTDDANLYRLNHPLAEKVLEQAKSRELPSVEIVFRYEEHEGKISALESLRNNSGWLVLNLLTVESFDEGEDHLIFTALTDNGEILDEETARRFLTIPGTLKNPISIEADIYKKLQLSASEKQVTIQQTIFERNAIIFDTEADKLDGWAEDLKSGLEREIKEMDRQIREANRASKTRTTLQEKLAGQKLTKALELQRNTKRKAIFVAHDDIDAKRDKLITDIEAKLLQRANLSTLFCFRWVLV